MARRGSKAADGRAWASLNRVRSKPNITELYRDERHNKVKHFLYFYAAVARPKGRFSCRPLIQTPHAKPWPLRGASHLQSFIGIGCGRVLFLLAQWHGDTDGVGGECGELLFGAHCTFICEKMCGKGGQEGEGAASHAMQSTPWKARS